MDELFEITGDSNKALLGMLSYPPKMKKCIKVIVVCYGFNGNRVDQHRILYSFSNFIVANGMVCVRFDYRNQGLSEGMFSELTMESKIQDVVDVINWVRQRLCQYSIKIYTLGFSDGAKSVMTLYRDNPSLFDGIVLWNPILTIDRPYLSSASDKNFSVTPRKIEFHPITKRPVIPFLGL